jgi:hypothetical protein
MAGSSKSVPGREPFRRRCGARCFIAIADAASRAHGGPTTLSNLAMLCRRHHRAVHEEGYQVERGPDGELRFRRHDECGLNIHARTAMPGWLGERLDVGWAIDVLHPLAAP